ncbi:unnamed protein product [Gongylonema pulchrum]|uniref:EF-hand domain-containing protein n=1 Tax=Gongylonema pulchrum TaxID=637853 RepID=A0A183DTL1_9BILA|nr:unnamed protein product [Gongylonema pulchrum]
MCCVVPRLLFRHIKEHLDGKVDPTANMTPEQLQFHYFNMHDVDRNGLLDGIELIKAITHFHDGMFGSPFAHPPKTFCTYVGGNGVHQQPIASAFVSPSSIYIPENPDPQQPGTHQPPPVLSETELERMLDPIFESDDLNKDGFISYAEFSKAQKQRDEARRQQASPPPPR